MGAGGASTTPALAPLFPSTAVVPVDPVVSATPVVPVATVAPAAPIVPVNAFASAATGVPVNPFPSAAAFPTVQTAQATIVPKVGNNIQAPMVDCKYLSYGRSSPPTA
jgi:hypothetical protein